LIAGGHQVGHIIPDLYQHPVRFSQIREPLFTIRREYVCIDE